jgi:hypothetical protein
VKKTSAVESQQFGPLQTHRHTHSDADESQPLAVSGCLVVALFHGLRQREQNAFSFVDRKIVGGPRESSHQRASTFPQAAGRIIIPRRDRLA